MSVQSSAMFPHNNLSLQGSPIAAAHCPLCVLQNPLLHCWLSVHLAQDPPTQLLEAHSTGSAHGLPSAERQMFTTHACDAQSPFLLHGEPAQLLQLSHTMSAGTQSPQAPFPSQTFATSLHGALGASGAHAPLEQSQQSSTWHVPLQPSPSDLFPSSQSSSESFVPSPHFTPPPVPPAALPPSPVPPVPPPPLSPPEAIEPPGGRGWPFGYVSSSDTGHPASNAARVTSEVPTKTGNPWLFIHSPFHPAQNVPRSMIPPTVGATYTACVCDGFFFAVSAYTNVPPPTTAAPMNI